MPITPSRLLVWHRRTSRFLLYCHRRLYPANRRSRFTTFDVFITPAWPFLKFCGTIISVECVKLDTETCRVSTPFFAAANAVDSANRDYQTLVTSWRSVTTRLFSRIRSNQQHVLYSLLSLDKTTICDPIDMTDRQLPAHVSRLMDCEFIKLTRILNKLSY